MVAACINIDGQAGAGPFGIGSQPTPVDQPFMFLTKETEIHPVLEEAFEQAGKGTFRVVVLAASHEQFADGSLFQPGLWPLDRTADQVNGITRGFTRAFFDAALADDGFEKLEIVEAPTDVYLYGYPLTPADQLSVRTRAGCSASSGS